MKTTHRTVDGIDVPLPGGRVFRIELHRHPDGQAAELVLSLDWRNPPRRVPREALTLPGECLADLRAALDALQGL